MANELAYIPFFVSDFLAAVMGWPTDRVGAYALALFYQVENGGLPNDDGEIGRILHAPSRATGARLWGEIRHKFYRGDDGRWRNARMDEVIAEARRQAAISTNRARAGAAARWGKGANGRHADRMHLAPPEQSTGSAEAMPEHCLDDANQIQIQSTTPPNPPSAKGGVRRKRKPTQAQLDESEQLRKTQEVKRLVHVEGLSRLEAAKRVFG